MLNPNSSFSSSLEITKKQHFLRHVHNFRGLAILIIVISHTLQSLAWNNNSATDIVSLSVMHNGSVYFVFIAGYLFQYLSKKYEYKNYLNKKFQNVILPYIFISIPAVWSCIERGHPAVNVYPWFSHQTVFGQILFLYATGTALFTFWFIPMISLFYIVSPIFIWIDRNPKTYRIIPLLVLLSLCINRTPDDRIIPAFLHFLSVYILGMFSSRHQEKLFSIVGRVWLPLIFIVVILTSLEIGIQIEVNSFETLSINTLGKAILCILLMYGLWRFDSHIPNLIHHHLGLLADLSFGIFFLHGYLNRLYTDGANYLFGADTFWLQKNIFSFFILLFFQIGASITLVKAVKLFLHKRSRYLVGC
jgi:hypothetical protein